MTKPKGTSYADGFSNKSIGMEGFANKTVAMDGFANKPQAITEGYLRKGGLNPPLQGVTRPPPPAAMKPAQTPAPTPPPQRKP